MKNSGKINKEVTLDNLFAWAESDPDLLDEWFDQQVNDLIAGAPEKHRRKLRGLQFKIDMERKKAKTPMAACITISRLMYDSFYELHSTLQHGGPISHQKPARNASVVDLRSRQPKNTGNKDE